MVGPYNFIFQSRYCAHLRTIQLVISIMQSGNRFKRLYRTFAIFDDILLQETWNISFNQGGFDIFYCTQSRVWLHFITSCGSNKQNSKAYINEQASLSPLASILDVLIPDKVIKILLITRASSL